MKKFLVLGGAIVLLVGLIYGKKIFDNIQIDECVQ